MAITREDVAHAIQRLDPGLAAALGDRQKSDIERIECPALSRYRVYVVTIYEPHAPVVHYVGYAEDGPAFVLTERPRAFLAMAKADGGVHITSAAEAARYAEVFLTSTRPLSRLVYVVKSASEVSFRRGLEPDEQATQEAFLAKFGDVIVAPQATASDKGFEVTIFWVVEQSLARVRLHVSRDGGITKSSRTLARDLPLVIGV